MGLKKPFESPFVSRSIILTSTMMPPACEFFLLHIYFLAKKGIVQVQVHGPKRGISKRVIVFLCDL